MTPQTFFTDKMCSEHAIDFKILQIKLTLPVVLTLEYFRLLGFIFLFYLNWCPLYNMLNNIWFLRRFVGVVSPDSRSRWESYVETSRAAQRMLNQADSWLSTCPAVYVLTQQCCYPLWQDTASGPNNPSQPSENPPSSLDPGILTDTPDPDMPFLSSPTNISTNVTLTMQFQYYRVMWAQNAHGQLTQTKLTQLWFSNFIPLGQSCKVQKAFCNNKESLKATERVY